MPKRSAPGNRDALEAALGPELLAVVYEMCLALGVKPHEWHRTPLIARPWEYLAAKRLADRIRTERGIGGDRAMNDAASTLGLNGETLRSRWKRAS